MLKKFSFVLLVVLFSSSAWSASLSTKIKINWVGQFSSQDGFFYFSSSHKDPSCYLTSYRGNYRVDGVNARGIYDMLLEAVARDKFVSFSLAGCAHDNHARVHEMYLHRY